MTGTSTNFLSSRPNGQAYYLSTIFSKSPCSAIDSGGAGGADARAPPEFWGSEKGQSLISAYRSLALLQQAHLDLKSYLRRWFKPHLGYARNPYIYFAKKRAVPYSAYHMETNAC